jgi:1-deoxy-D-xylulose-5-phosphate reductoisomerase
VAPAVLNAANEVAVDAFLNGRLAFNAIATVVAATLDALGHGVANDLDGVLAADAAARAHAGAAIHARH